MSYRYGYRARNFMKPSYADPTVWAPALDRANKVLGDLSDSEAKIVKDIGDYRVRNGGITQRQVDLLNAIVDRQEQRAATVTISLDNIYQSMQFALNGGAIKQPRMSFSFPNSHLAITYRDVKPGELANVYIFQNKKYVGKITPDGKAMLRPELSPENRQFLLDLDRDFFGTVGDYGRKSGACGFCARTLTDEVSLKNGYGPICGSRYNRLSFVAKKFDEEYAKGEAEHADELRANGVPV